MHHFRVVWPHRGKKTFQYEVALHLHDEPYGKEKPKPFKCSDCRKCFARKATLEHHQQHFHLSQQGSGVKRTLEKETREVKRARHDLPKKIDEKVIPEPDREDSMLEGNKVNAYFYLKTKSQRVDQKEFLKESVQRLEKRLKKVLKEKKAVNWSLVYHCEMFMPDK